jgi:DNA-binding GntR family transcriptional regulator
MASMNGGGLTAVVCQEHADECRALARIADEHAVRVMLEHIAGTWERIAERLTKARLPE